MSGKEMWKSGNDREKEEGQNRGGLKGRMSREKKNGKINKRKVIRKLTYYLSLQNMRRGRQSIVYYRSYLRF